MAQANGTMEEWERQLNHLGAAATPCFFLVDFECQAPRLWTLDHADCPSFEFPTGSHGNQLSTSAITPRIIPDHLAEKDFRWAFEIIQRGLRRGDSFLANLTFPIPVRLVGDLDDVYRASQAKYRVWLPGRFVCFSPETFVTIDEGGYIESRPMKGTAVNKARDRRALRHSPKEIAEHATIVDLIRNDLSMVAKQVRVTKYRYFHEISTSRRGLVQTSSDIGGQLPAGWRHTLGTTLGRLLPAGSVSGAPKGATLELIRRAEGRERGYYCGIAGYFDGHRLDTCVLIRFIERHPSGETYFRSGGGITARSSWVDELAELKAKVRIPLSPPP